MFLALFPSFEVVLEIPFLTELKDGYKLLALQHNIIVFNNMGIFQIFKNCDLIEGLLLTLVRSIEDGHFFGHPVACS